MNTMEDLTKTQIILLTLLVSFVTSIATGIITTSLLAEAPAGITQTINRVVEHTIEKVVAPAPTGGVTSTVKDVTVINEDDAVTSAVTKASAALVRLGNPPVGSQNGLYALGTIITKSGLVLSDKNSLILRTPYSVMLSDGTQLTATAVFVSETDNIVLFQIEADAKHKDNFPFISLGKADVKLGQTVITVAGKDKNAVRIGRATSFVSRTEKDSKGQDVNVIYEVETDIPASAETEGAPLLNLSGDMVGIKSSNSDLTLSTGTYTSLLPIVRLLEKVT